MSEQPRVSQPKERLLSMDVETFDSLAELALCGGSSRITLGSSYKRSRGRQAKRDAAAADFDDPRFRRELAS
jgi:hypothetical protein